MLYGFDSFVLFILLCKCIFNGKIFTFIVSKYSYIQKKINHGMHFIFASEFRTRGRALSLEENTRTLLLLLLLLLAKISRNMFVYLLRHPLWNFFTMFSRYSLAFFSWNMFWCFHRILSTFLLRHLNTIFLGNWFHITM